MDIIRSEADAYDVLIFTDSWLKLDISDTTVHIENFSQPFRNDRRNRLGGGVLAYVRESITCKRCHDLEINGLEAVWLELFVKTKKVLVAGIYRPPNSNLAYMDLIKESVDRAYNTNIVDIIIAGDFNFNMALNSDNRITELMNEFRLSQIWHTLPNIPHQRLTLFLSVIQQTFCKAIYSIPLYLIKYDIIAQSLFT